MSVGFNPQKFVAGSPDYEEHKLEDIPEVVEAPVAKRGRPKKKDSTPAVATESTMPQTSMSYIQTNIPYGNAYQDTNRQLDESIEQLNILGSELMGELMNVRQSKTLKAKYNYVNDMTETITNIINAKISAIKEKNKTINDINNIELRRVKDLKSTLSEEDDNTRIMNMYDAFINTPIGMGGGRNVLGPNATDMMMAGGAPDLSRAVIGNDQQVWEQNLSPAENRMLLDAKGVIETVVMYDASSGNTRGGYAKDKNRNVTYRLIVINGGEMTDY